MAGGGKKRGREHGGKGGGGNGGKRSFHGNKSFASLVCEQHSNKQMVICTCEQNKERDATKDLILLLTEYADKLCPLDEEEEKEDSNVNGGSEDRRALSIEEQIRKEVQELKAGAGQASRFIGIHTDTNAVVCVVARREEEDMVRLIRAILADVRTESKFQSRYIIRIWPLAKLCFGAVTEKLLEVAKPLIEEAFSAGQVDHSGAADASSPAASGDPAAASAGDTPAAAASAEEVENGEGVKEEEKGGGGGGGGGHDRTTTETTVDGSSECSKGPSPSQEKGATAGFRYKVEMRKRYTDKLQKAAAIDGLVACIPNISLHKVDLKNPQLTILVEAVKGVAGVSVVPDFMETEGYNLRKMQDKYAGGGMGHDTDGDDG